MNTILINQPNEGLPMSEEDGELEDENMESDFDGDLDSFEQEENYEHEEEL